jgi:FkbM family methyltransferase
MNAPPASPLEMVRRILASPGAPRTTGDAIDVGAHTGAFADELLRSGLFSRVIAFEPNPVNADALSARASRDARLTVVRAAAGEHARQGELYCDSDSATGSLLEYRDHYETSGSVRRMTVAVVSLDGYLERAAPDAAPIRLLKIDTQGHDLAVLRGARRLLASDRPVVIAELIYVPMYTGQAEPDDILAAMRASGYDLHALFNIHATSEGRLAFADALFAPREYQETPSQQYVQVDNHASYLTQIATLERICRERLEVINVLDAEVKRLSAAKAMGS